MGGIVAHFMVSDSYEGDNYYIISSIFKKITTICIYTIFNTLGWRQFEYMPITNGNSLNLTLFPATRLSLYKNNTTNKPRSRASVHGRASILWSVWPGNVPLSCLHSPLKGGEGILHHLSSSLTKVGGNSQLKYSSIFSTRPNWRVCKV